MTDEFLLNLAFLMCVKIGKEFGQALNEQYKWQFYSLDMPVT